MSLLARWRSVAPSAPPEARDRIAALERDPSPEAAARREFLDEVQVPLVPDEPRFATLRRAEADLERRLERAQWKLEKALEQRALRGESAVPDSRIARLQAEVDRLDRLLTKVWPHTHPAVLFDGRPLGPIPAVCRTPGCGAVVAEDAGFRQAGYCDKCWQIGTGQRAPDPLDLEEAWLNGLVG